MYLDKMLLWYHVGVNGHYSVNTIICYAYKFKKVDEHACTEDTMMDNFVSLWSKPIPLGNK